MSKRSALKAEVLRLAENIPDDPSLAQAQYAYRQIIYFMGLKILETFPEAAIGLPPSGREDHEAFYHERLTESINVTVQAEIAGGFRYPEIGATGGGGQGPGGHINAIIGKVMGIVLGLKPPAPVPPPK
jgi:hypothetical protein